MPLPNGLAGDAESRGDHRPGDAGRDELVDLAVDRDVELPPLVDELRKSFGRLAGRHRRDIFAGLGRGLRRRGQRVLSGGLAVAASLSSAHAREPAGSL